MLTTDLPVQVYLEIGKKRVFAGALDWPGWCRAGRSSAEALAALAASGPRYSAVVAPTAPDRGATLVVCEELTGGSGTDFGVPEAIPAADAPVLDRAALDRQLALLDACWNAFAAGAAAAAGRSLHTGPRGGGRNLDGLVVHVLEAQRSYLGRINAKAPPLTGDAAADLASLRQASSAALIATGGATPAPGPRGGARWPPRYFVRRAAWHILDHLWEIGDRTAE